LLQVIIVEDELMIRRGLKETIDWQSMGCEVAGEAGDGAAGLALLKCVKPDIIMTDIKMPNMSGLEMIEAAKRQNLLKADCKVILLTSYAEFTYAQQAIHLQVFDYLLKPLEEDKLRELIVPLTSRGAKVRLINWEEYLGEDVFLNSYVKESLVRIKENYQAKISVENLADEMNISASYLSRKFKEATGHTFLEMLSKKRIEAAAELLIGGKHRVYEVAEQAGFNDYKNFCLVFKRYMNKTPKEFMGKFGQ
jgi:two-component system response regulator YesN